MAVRKSPAPKSARADAPAQVANPKTVVEAVPDAASPIEDVVGVDPVMETLTTNMAELPKRISGVVSEIDKTQTEVKTHMDKAMKSAEELVSFGQGNVEAILKSSQIWAAGVQDLGKHFAATAQAQMDETMATVKALTSVKSLKEAMDLQATLAKSAMEKMVAETGKLTDASVKLAEQTMAPITARVTLAAEKFAKTA